MESRGSYRSGDGQRDDEGGPAARGAVDFGRAAAFGLLLDDAERFGGVGFVGKIEGVLGGEQHGVERVVDLVCDSGGECADGGQTLGSTQLFEGDTQGGGALGDKAFELVAVFGEL